jgi:uncharacterized protein
MTVSDLRNPDAATALSVLCRKYHILELAAFGSFARGEARHDSDLDLFVEFAPGYHPGLAWFDLEDDLQAIAGRPIDLSRKSLLKPHVRNEALRDAVVLYAA